MIKNLVVKKAKKEKSTRLTLFKTNKHKKMVKRFNNATIYHTKYIIVDIFSALIVVCWALKYSKAKLTKNVKQKIE